MGMSIDEAIGLLERGSQYNYYDSAEDFCKAYDMSIEIMRKYKKIEEIVKSKTTRLSYEDGFRQIKEVLENANN